MHYWMPPFPYHYATTRKRASVCGAENSPGLATKHPGSPWPFLYPKRVVPPIHADDQGGMMHPTMRLERPPVCGISRATGIQPHTRSPRPHILPNDTKHDCQCHPSHTRRIRFVWLTPRYQGCCILPVIARACRNELLRQQYIRRRIVESVPHNIHKIKLPLHVR